MWLPILFSLASSLNPETWIGDSLSVIGNKSLQNITLPGTHDSGTYYLTDIPMPGDTSAFLEELYRIATKLSKDVGKFIIEWSQTQDKTFYQQMQGGIRYFDLRAGWNRTTSTWVTFHFVEGSPVQWLLQNISQYLQDYPKEIVIVEISHFDGYPTSSAITLLRNLVQQSLGQFLYQVDINFGFTVNQMVSTGKRALVTMEKGFDGVYIWPPSAIHNTYADTPNLQEMVNFNTKTVQQYMNGTWNNMLFKVSWTLTANSTTVEDSIIPFHPHTLIELADQANRALPAFWSNIKKDKWTTGNILIIDHFETSSIMSVIWSMNGLS